MTLIEKTIEVPATTRKETNLQCDICGAMAEGEDWDRSDDGVLNQATEVEISLKKKEHYPDSSGYDGEVFDCCPTCFRDKVRPALLALGLKPRKTELSW